MNKEYLAVCDNREECRVMPVKQNLKSFREGAQSIYVSECPFYRLWYFFLEVVIEGNYVDVSIVLQFEATWLEGSIAWHLHIAISVIEFFFVVIPYCMAYSMFSFTISTSGIAFVGAERHLRVLAP